MKKTFKVKIQNRFGTIEVEADNVVQAEIMALEFHCRGEKGNILDATKYRDDVVFVIEKSLYLKFIGVH